MKDENPSRGGVWTRLAAGSDAGAQIFRWLGGICVVLAIVGLFTIHGHFDFEHIPVFYGLFGFVAFVFIVYAGKGLRKLVMRSEDYYDR